MRLDISRPARLGAAIIGTTLCAVVLHIHSVQAKPGQSSRPNAAALTKCGVALVMPGYMPPGFKLASFRQDPCPGVMAGYEAVFKGPNRCQFSIAGSNGGWGAPGPLREWRFRSPLLGPIVLEEWDGSMLKTPNYLNASAIPTGGAPVLAAYPRAGYVFNFSCQDNVFSPDMAKRIIIGAKI